MPAVRIENLTHPDNTLTYRAGDRLRISITGAPHEQVYKSSSDGHDATTVRIGITDVNGRFAAEQLAPSRAGLQTEVWSVGQSEASPALTYVPANATCKAHLMTTTVGNPRDRYGMALSVLSALDKTVVIYFGLELSYPTNLYYDLRTIATVFQEQTPVKTATESSSASVARILEVPAIRYE